jgi:hypothetical protein
VDFLDGFLFDFLDKLGGLDDDDFVSAWGRAVTVRRRRQVRRVQVARNVGRDDSALRTRVTRLEMRVDRHMGRDDSALRTRITRFPAAAIAENHGWAR